MGDVIRVPRVVRTGPYSMMSVWYDDEGNVTKTIFHSLERPPRPPKKAPERRRSRWASWLAWAVAVRNVRRKPNVMSPNVVPLDDRRTRDSGR